MDQKKVTNLMMVFQLQRPNKVIMNGKQITIWKMTAYLEVLLQHLPVKGD